MWAKALWMRNYKQGKVVIWSLWLVSLLLLSLPFGSQARMLEGNVEQFGTSNWWFNFAYGPPLLYLGSLSILLGILLTGWERQTQGMDLMLALPFNRKDLFLSKWLLGVVNLAGITLINFLLMLLIHHTSVLAQHQTFAPFFVFFPYMFVFLVTVYTVTLFMGFLSGHSLSQGFLAVIALLTPLLPLILIAGGIHQHLMWLGRGNGQNLVTLMDSFFQWTPLYGLMSDFYFSWDRMNTTVNLFENNLVGVVQYVVLGVFFLISFVGALLLSKKNPSENNGKMVMYKKLEPYVLWLGTFFSALSVSLLMGNTLWFNTAQGSLAMFWVSFFLSGILCYVILSKLMQKPLKFRKGGI